MEITKEIQFDAGHRIPFHKAQCRHVHGHRYRVVATLEGEPVEQPGASDHGMVMDFGDMKRILMQKVHDPLDHGFIVWEGDSDLRQFLENAHYKLVVMGHIPTAENIARWCYEQTKDAFVAAYGNTMRLKSITVWETPTSSATFAGE